MVLAILESSTASNVVVGIGLFIVAVLAWYGLRKTDPKLAPRIRSPRAEDYDLAGGSWRNYRSREFAEDHRSRTRVGL